MYYAYLLERRDLLLTLGVLVTTGNNSLCNVEGFYAVEGWDPVSGLGTPDYPKLLEVFMALP